jgi:hypothetical protein
LFSNDGFYSLLQPLSDTDFVTNFFAFGGSRPQLQRFSEHILRQVLYVFVTWDLICICSYVSIWSKLDTDLVLCLWTWYCVCDGLYVIWLMWKLCVWECDIVWDFVYEFFLYKLNWGFYWNQESPYFRRRFLDVENK